VAVAAALVVVVVVLLLRRLQCWRDPTTARARR
jgi:hypothetical protein